MPWCKLPKCPICRHVRAICLASKVNLISWKAKDIPHERYSKYLMIRKNYSAYTKGKAGLLLGSDVHRWWMPDIPSITRWSHGLKQVFLPGTFCRPVQFLSYDSLIHRMWMDPDTPGYHADLDRLDKTDWRHSQAHTICKTMVMHWGQWLSKEMIRKDLKK